MAVLRVALVAGLGCVSPALAQPAAPAAPASAATAQPALLPVPPALRGAWFDGECTAPRAMLQVTARAVVRLPSDAPARLIRFGETRRQQAGAQTDWHVGIGRGAEAPRILLRGDGTALQTAEPDAKLRDDRLPGDTPLQSWHRCPSPPPAFAALHGEGLAFLGSLEVLEAACGGASASPAGCVAAIVQEGDVSGDKLLSVAEIARMVRGMTWVLAAAEDAAPEGVMAAGGGGLLAGVAIARFAMESLDYDGDGKLSAAELGQDRAVFARALGSEGGRPLRLEGVQEGVTLLRTLLDSTILGQ
ncbi:hypothetical protein BKE38_26700 [Pseudoroseomonas deserti]|uniref:EF-hand domain-containing protein n=1 Tax=Teichococcus deserti TaxID=1817963 RepID=A0A1V2GUG4_9PROT|nr:hypothetical protein [Pseudoroseomonas deserti]ONG45241.1 hypothetical protein BKE38_26700 [Pseudoroseomonas deserti]